MHRGLLRCRRRSALVRIWRRRPVRGELEGGIGAGTSKAGLISGATAGSGCLLLDFFRCDDIDRERLGGRGAEQMHLAEQQQQHQQR